MAGLSCNQPLNDIVSVGNDGCYCADGNSGKEERKGFFYSYNAVFDTDMSAHAKLLYLYLCRCSDANAHCFPSRKTMAAALSVSLTSVHNAVVELESMGLLSRKPYYRRDGSQTANTYMLFNPNDVDVPVTQSTNDESMNDSTDMVSGCVADTMNGQSRGAETGAGGSSEVESFVAESGETELDELEYQVAHQEAAGRRTGVVDVRETISPYHVKGACGAYKGARAGIMLRLSARRGNIVSGAAHSKTVPWESGCIPIATVPFDKMSVGIRPP